MGYQLPVFNMSSRISTDYGSPASGLSYASAMPCQKYINSRGWPNLASTANYWGSPAAQWRYEPTAFYAVFPPTQIAVWNISIIRVEPAAAVYYRVWNWEIIHEGFPNEYPVLYALLCDPNTGMYLTPGSANLVSLDPAFPFEMGPLP